MCSVTCSRGASPRVGFACIAWLAVRRRLGRRTGPWLTCSAALLAQERDACPDRARLAPCSEARDRADSRDDQASSFAGECGSGRRRTHRGRSPRHQERRLPDQSARGSIFRGCAANDQPLSGNRLLISQQLWYKHLIGAGGSPGPPALVVDQSSKNAGYRRVVHFRSKGTGAIETGKESRPEEGSLLALALVSLAVGVATGLVGAAFRLSLQRFCGRPA